MSSPCLSTCVGSCIVQNTSSSFSYGTIFSSYSISIASACPVVWLHTCSYVGFFVFPPVYPTVVFSTPFISLYASSTCQKHPHAKVALLFVIFSMLVSIFSNFIVDGLIKEIIE